MSMQHDLKRLKRQPKRETKTFQQVQREAEAYEQQRRWGMAAVMWNVAESLAESTAQRELARTKRRENSEKR